MVFIDKIYIIGAGIAGLSTYHFLKDKKIIHIFEKNNYIGGRIKSICSGTSFFEIGSQFFCKSDKNIWKIIDEKKLQNDLVKLDFSNISFHYRGESICDINEIIRVIEEVLSKQVGKNLTFDEWFLQNFDKDKLFIPKGVIRAITFSDSSTILANYCRYILETFFDECFTLKEGLEELIRNLAYKANIQNATVNRLVLENNLVSEIITNQGSIDTKKDFIVFTAPPNNVIIQNHDKLSEILNNIKFNGCAVIIFKVKKRFRDYPDYIFFSEEKYKISVIEQFEINNNEFIGCLVPYSSSINKQEITSYIISFLGEMFNCKFEERIIDTFYEAWDAGLPVVDKYYVKIVDELSSLHIDNLIFAGDFTTLLPSMDSAVKSGIDVAKKLDKVKR